MNDSFSGVMIPIPQYPLYTASIALRKGNAVNYYLDEENGWSIDIDHLEESLANAKEGGINVRGFVLINPGNPTGQVLSREAMHEVVNFCSRNKLVLMADEVYQENVYDDNAEFVSAKRAAFETGLLEVSTVGVFSTLTCLLQLCQWLLNLHLVHYRRQLLLPARCNRARLISFHVKGTLWRMWPSRGVHGSRRIRRKGCWSLVQISVLVSMPEHGWSNHDGSHGSRTRGRKRVI
jgi:hypothetical protein